MWDGDLTPDRNAQHYKIFIEIRWLLYNDAVKSYRRMLGDDSLRNTITGESKLFKLTSIIHSATIVLIWGVKSFWTHSKYELDGQYRSSICNKFCNTRSSFNKTGSGYAR